MHMHCICTCLRHPTQADVHVEWGGSPHRTPRIGISRWPRKQKMALSYHRCYATLRGVIRMIMDAASARCRRILKRVYDIERKILMTRHHIAYSGYSLSGCASSNTLTEPLPGRALLGFWTQKYSLLASYVSPNLPGWFILWKLWGSKNTCLERCCKRQNWFQICLSHVV